MSAVNSPNRSTPRESALCESTPRESALRESALRAGLEASCKRVDELERALRALDDERESLLEKIRGEQEIGDELAGDLYEIETADEERRLEWAIEREPSELAYRAVAMPWERGREDDRRFARALARSLSAALLLGVLLPWIPLPVPERWELIEVPDRFVRLMEERIEPPPVQELLPEPKPIEEQPLLAEKGMPEPVVGEQKPTPAGGSKGILAFREQFSALAEKSAPARLGSQARITRSGEAASGRATRALVTTDGPGTSGGIDIAALSRDVGGAGGAGLEGVAVARASSAISGVGGNADRPLSGGPGSARTDEAIQIVFDRHKAALYRLYNRELRRDPTLQGQIVLRMTIEPDGSVSFCEVQRSDMKAPDLVAQVVDRVKSFDFGAEEGIPAITILYPIDFLPAA